MVREAVQQRCDQLGVVEHAGAFREAEMMTLVGSYALFDSALPVKESAKPQAVCSQEDRSLRPSTTQPRLASPYTRHAQFPFSRALLRRCIYETLACSRLPKWSLSS